MQNITIKAIEEVSLSLINEISLLIPQLTPTPINITQETLEALVLDKNSELIGAYDSKDRLIGTLSLIVFQIPTGKKAFIEDVVVDESARGIGLGEKLLIKAIELAKEKGVQRIELSSRPSRIAANKLYQKFGFEIRQTNFYRLEL